MDEAQKRLEARKARLDEARKKRVNNLKRPGESAHSPSFPESQPSTLPTTSSSPSLPCVSGSKPAAPASLPPTTSNGKTTVPPSAPGAVSSVLSTPSGVVRPTTSGAPSSPSVSAPSPFAPASSSWSGFAKPLPPSSRPRPGGGEALSPQGSPFVGFKLSPKSDAGPSPSPTATSSPSAIRCTPLSSKPSSDSVVPSPAPSASAPRPVSATGTGPSSSYVNTNLQPVSSPLATPSGAQAPSSDGATKGEHKEAGNDTRKDEEERKRSRVEEVKMRVEEIRKQREAGERRAIDLSERRKEKENKVQGEQHQPEAKRTESVSQQSIEQQQRLREVEEKLEKKLRYVQIFVDMQKKERERTKVRRQEARAARQLRIQQKKEAGASPDLPQQQQRDTALPVVSPVPPAVASHPPPGNPPHHQQPEEEEKEEEEKARVESAEEQATDTAVDQEIRMIIEIGKLKEEVDRYKKLCMEEEARVAGLRQQIQIKAEAEARRKRGWVAVGSASAKDGSTLSAYHTKDITRRPLVGGARFFSVYTPAGGGSPLDGYEPAEERKPTTPAAPVPAPAAATDPAPPSPSPDSSDGADGSSNSGRGKLKRSKSGRILRSFLSTYIPSSSAASSSTLASSQSSLTGSGDSPTRDLGSSASSFDDVRTGAVKKSGSIRKRELRKSFSLEMGVALRKKKNDNNKKDGASTDSDSDDKKKEKERLRQEKREKKEKERKEKEMRKKRGGKPVTVFNSTLEEVMSLQGEADGEVPIILKTLTNAIFSSNGHQTEGIFRLSPSVSDVSQLKDQLNAQNYELTTTDPHVIASVLKLWFRELSQPVIPHEFYDECIKKAHYAEQIKQLVAALPPINQKVIEFFACFLLQVAKEENVAMTKMGLDNLAIVFSPGFLRCLDPMKMMANSALEGLFVENLIELYKA